MNKNIWEQIKSIDKDNNSLPQYKFQKSQINQNAS